MTSDDTVLDMHEEAVAHARRANRAAYLGWRHLRSEYSQDMEFVLSTIETKGPWTWTLPLGGMAGAEDAAPGSTEAPPADGSEHLSYISATNMEEIREQYVGMRDAVQVWDWISMTDIRTGYYMITHGVARLKDVPTSEWFEVESVTMFPIGNDGILGEVQIGDFANERPGRWPEVPGADGVVPLPINKLQASMLHNEYMDALRAEDVDRIVATFRPNTANAIRSYLTDDYTVLNAEGAEALGDYYRALFERYTIKDIRMINRVVESWFVFSDLHWTVEAKTGDKAGQTFEFCTADLAPIDSNGKFWVRTGIGTDPVASAAAGPEVEAPYGDERGPKDVQGWEYDLVG